MDNNKVETLKKVLDLEVYIKETKRTLSKLHHMSFDSAPEPPVCQKINKTYPEIKPTIKFNWIIALVPLFIGNVLFWKLAEAGDEVDAVFIFLMLPIWIIVYYFAIYKKQKTKNIEQIRNSAEYEAQCAEIDAECDRQQAIANQKYEEETRLYETEILPNYQKKLDEWTANHEKKIEQTQQDLRNAQQNLSLIYQETKIVPSQYRTIEALNYIYEMISTSDYDIKEAVDMYDKAIQRQQEAARIEELQRANDLADQQNYHLAQQNALIDEQNAISERQRMDDRRRELETEYHRRQVRKQLKNK